MKYKAKCQYNEQGYGTWHTVKKNKNSRCKSSREFCELAQYVMQSIEWI